MLCGHCCDTLTNFIFESVFTKWSLMGHWSMGVGWFGSLSSCIVPHPARTATSSSATTQCPLLPSASSGDLGLSVERIACMCPMWPVLGEALRAPLRVCTCSVSILCGRSPVLKSKWKKHHEKTRERLKKHRKCFFPAFWARDLVFSFSLVLANYVAHWNLRSTG